MKKTLLSLFCCIILILTSCNSPKKVKYIFYFIGDGMGLAQTMLTENYLDAISLDTTTVHLELNKIPVTGFATTYSANSMVTCSAAAGTALSTGHKTKNGMLGVLPDTIPVESIANKLHGKGYAIGIITSVSLDHATPGAFFAHVPHRDMFEDITKDMAESNFEFFGGGGLLSTIKNPNSWQYLTNNGYTVTNDKTKIDSFKLKDGKLFAYSNILCSSEDIPYRIDNPNHEMNISYFLKKALNFFDYNKGFFIMIEGGKIDWACHGNDAATAIHEVIDFDNAYKVAYDFYLKHPKETLIVMTSDHETGGLSIGQKSTNYDCFPHILKYQKISEESFNEKIDTISANYIPSLNEIYSLLEKKFGFNNKEEKLLTLNRKDSTRIELVYYNKYEKKEISTDALKAYDIRTKETISSIAVKIINEKAGIGWTTNAHSGIAVPVRAIGVGKNKFTGFYDNTDIPKKIMEILQQY